MSTTRSTYMSPTDEGANAYQSRLGYSRGIRRGPLLSLSGCTSFKEGTTQHVGSAYKQAIAAFETSLEAISSLCAPELAKNPGLDVRSFVTRIRMYCRSVEDCEDVGKAMADVMGAGGETKEIAWAATLLAGIDLVAPEMLVEVEVEAWVD